MLWEQLGYAAKYGDILDAPWPKVDAAALKQEEIDLVLQVNGKLRGKLRVPAAADALPTASACVFTIKATSARDSAIPIPRC